MSLTLNPLAGGLDSLLWGVAGRNGLVPAASPVTDTVRGAADGTLNTVADPLYTSDQEGWEQMQATRPLQEIYNDMQEQASLEQALAMYRKDDETRGSTKWSATVTSPADELGRAIRGEPDALARNGWPDGTTDAAARRE